MNRPLDHARIGPRLSGTGIGVILILAFSALVRLWDLDLKPPHFDEGVNGWFADQMTRTGYYPYDPTNYHGPLHMYAVFITQTLLGRNLWALRLPAILASVLAVWAVLLFRRHLGDRIALTAALFMAVSPAFVFFGRYSIHESWLVVFVLLTTYGVIGLWCEGKRSDLWWVVAGLTGMVLTKETYVIHAGTLVLAFPFLRLWELVVPSRPGFRWARQCWGWADFGRGVLVGGMVIIAFYSGFFLNFAKLSGLWETFAAWFATGVEAAGHEKTEFQFGPLNFYWVWLMARYEWPSLLGLAGCFVLMLPADARIRWIAICGGGVLLAYSLIPYKTPWCVISVIWPFLFTGAWLVWRLPTRWAVSAITLLSLANFLWMARLNFFEFTNDGEPYVYVQTYEEAGEALKKLVDAADEDPRFLHAPGRVILESYYPVPWILGDFTSVGYYSEGEVPAQITDTFIICRGDDVERVRSALKGSYREIEFRLRSGVEDCHLFLREDNPASAQ